jgi:SP family sugar:H+ symporter-like MFS transporter
MHRNCALADLFSSFGYDTGQISGFLAMPNFLERFGQFNEKTGKFYFSNVRSGLIVALVSSSVVT